VVGRQKAPPTPHDECMRYDFHKSGPHRSVGNTWGQKVGGGGVGGLAGLGVGGGGRASRAVSYFAAADNNALS